MAFPLIINPEAEGDLDEINPLLHDSGEKFRNIGKEIMFNRKK